MAAGGVLYAGCRDGKLYAFSADGKALWRYTVPGSEQKIDSPYFRPSPYYVSAGDDIVAFSSFENLFVLNKHGKLLYRWTLPENKVTTKTQQFTMTISTGPGAIRALCAARTGNRVWVASDDGVFELVDGRMRQQVKPNVEFIHSMAASPADHLLGLSGADKVILFKEGKPTGSFRFQGNGRVRFNPAANRIVAWAGKNLSVATYGGTLIAEIEFAKNIHFAECLDDGRVLVATRYLILLDTNGKEKPAPPPERQTTARGAIRNTRPREEAGIPIRWIEAQKISVGRGKAVYQGAQGQELTIEQAALAHYRTQGYRGTWTENDYWWEIMALLFWDVIFAKIPGTYSPQFGDFPSRMQDMPQDFFLPAFYARRKSLIEKRLRALTSPKLFGLVKTSLADELGAAYKRHFGKPCRPIGDWNRFSLETLLLSLKTIPPDKILLLLKRLLEDFNENRRGLPDLFLVDSSGKSRFVEVKAEKEKLPEHQLAWLTFMKNQAGITVEICRVIST